MLRLDCRLEFTPYRSRPLKFNEALSAEAPARYDRVRGIWCHVGKLLRRGEVNAHPQISAILSLAMIAQHPSGLPKRNIECSGACRIVICRWITIL